MRIGLEYITPVLAAAAAALAIGAAPPAAADSEFCTNLNTGATKCEKQGDVEINDGLSRANVMSQWAEQGGESGGPYDGTLGGGPR